MILGEDWRLSLLQHQLSFVVNSNTVINFEKKKTVIVAFAGQKEKSNLFFPTSVEYQV